MNSKRLLSVVVVIVCLAAAWDVSQGWNRSINNILKPINPNAVCLDWLRDQHPGADLTVWQFGYIGITGYVNNRIRIFDVLADFEMSPIPNTVGYIDLTQSLPAYAIGWVRGDRSWLLKNGYRSILTGPRIPVEPDTNFPCLYERQDVLSYAYTVAEPTLDVLKPIMSDDLYPIVLEMPSLPPDQTTPVTTYRRQWDNIILLANGDPSGQGILTLQERAYPGWRVEVDGIETPLESVGGQIGIRLPQDSDLHTVYFEYHPPLFIIGAWITLAASIFTILYLLRAERIFVYVRKRQP